MFESMLNTFGDWLATQIQAFLDVIIYFLGQNLVLTTVLTTWDPWVRMTIVTQVGASVILMAIAAFVYVSRYFAEISPSDEAAGTYTIKVIISAAIIWASPGIVRFAITYGARLQSDFLNATRIRSHDLDGGAQLVEHLTVVLGPVLGVGIGGGVAGGGAGGVAAVGLIVAIVALAFAVLFCIIFWQMLRRTGEIGLSMILAPLAATNFQSQDQMIIKQWGRHLFAMLITHAIQTAFFMLTLRAALAGIPALDGGSGVFALLITMVLGGLAVKIPQVLDGYVHTLAPSGAAGTGMQAASTVAIMSRMR